MQNYISTNTINKKEANVDITDLIVDAIVGRYNILMEKMILVDKNDKEIGFEEKLKAHQNGGKLHRAFSIFVFNSKGELLAPEKSQRENIIPRFCGPILVAAIRGQEKILRRRFAAG